MRRAERYYNAHAPDYESKFRKPLVARAKRMEEEGILSFLFERLPPKGRLLELGCGTGLFTLPLAEKGYEIIATDLSYGMLAEFERKLNGAGLTNVTLVRADCEGEFPCTGGLDGIYGIGLLEYMTSPGRLLAHAFRALRPGGVAVFTAPTLSLPGFCYYVTSLARKHIRMKLFTRRGLAGLFTNGGFESIEVRRVGFHLPLATPLTRAAAGRRPE